MNTVTIEVSTDNESLKSVGVEFKIKSDDNLIFDGIIYVGEIRTFKVPKGVEYTVMEGWAHFKGKKVIGTSNAFGLERYLNEDCYYPCFITPNHEWQDE